MSEKVIRPDLKFVNDVIRGGGGSLKKCFQCATCTVVCNLTPDDKPFPRKEMVQAQWGLKSELLRNPDIWLCHQCSDCTAYCPRGANPGEVLGAIRKMSIERYSVPRFLARAVGDSRFLVLLAAVPVVLFILMLAKLGNLSIDAIPRGEGGEIVYSNFVPIWPYVDGTFTLAAMFAAAVFAFGVVSYWKDMSRGVKLSGGIIEALISTVKEILWHGNFRKCDVTNQRNISHMLVLFSFIGLAITTSWAVFYLYVLHIPSPYPLGDPMKLLGNISAVALLAGLGLVIVYRINNAEKAGLGSYYDWLFIGVVALIAVTGVLAELSRLANIASLAYPVYFLHLVCVFFLFIYAPFSKMAHMVYRTTAMVFARMSGRSAD
jgi:quinone-modifying oxidoreductase subunit QmoC